MVKTLIISAHPDDEVLGCGGMMAKIACETYIVEEGRGTRYDNKFDKIPLLDWIQRVEGVIERVKPEVVFTHYHNDRNIDHKIIFQAVECATRPESSCVKELYSFEVLSSTMPDFVPDMWIGLDRAHTETKIELLKAKYGNEMRNAPHPRSYRAIRNLACFRGSQCNSLYAEAFKVVRIIKREM